MNEYKSIIDYEGNLIEKCVLFVNGVSQFFELKEEEQAVERINNNMLKPHYVDGKWIETATQEELNEAYPVINMQPTADEILRAKLIKDNADMQLQLAQQQKLNADILLKIANLGGSANV